MSGIIFGGGSIDLTAPPTNIGTATPPAITVSTLFRSANSGNVAFVAQPFGTGAFQLQQTDNTVAGGNARGARAVDLQLERQVASQVASGSASFVAGSSNLASGLNSVAVGQANFVIAQSAFSAGQSNNVQGQAAFVGGQTNTAAGNWSFTAGLNNIASGVASTAFGNRVTTKGVQGLLAVGTDIHNVAGATQTTITTLGVQTTSDTPIILRSSTVAASVTNQLVLSNNSSIAFTAIVTATTTAAGDCSSWKFEGQIQRGANAASTALVAAITPVLIAQKAGAVTWAVAVTADTTNGALAVTVTGQAATTIRWTCTLFASEVAF